MVGMIAACNPDYVIGVNGQIPWKAPVDLRRFRDKTMGGCVIMGRTTWDSLPSPLRGRHNIVLTRDESQIPMITGRARNQSLWVKTDACTSLSDALILARLQNKDIWICGGGEVYRDALLADVVDVIDLTVVDAKCDVPVNPEDTLRVTYFPFDIMLEHFWLRETVVNQEDPRLKHLRYERW